RVIFGLIGAPLEALPGILHSLEIQGMSANLVRSMLPDLNAAIENIWQFVDRIIVQRQQHGGGDEDDILNALISAKEAGQLNDAELHNILIFLFGAGYDTSKNMLTFIMHAMLQHPDYWKRCAEDRPYCDKVVEETLRYNSVSSLYRAATEDVVYRDILFP